MSILDPLRVLYEDPADPHNILLVYSQTSVSKSSSSWNREHLWPRARGDSDQAGPDDSDLFHVVPADTSVNNVRGNLYFDESNPNDPGYVIPAAPLAPQTSRDSDSWQPAPSERGDIARALFYMEVRYDGTEPNTTDMELVSYPPSGSQMANLNTLLLWNEQDPPDDAERRRNDLIFSDYQHNRNPFIDHPEWVQAIWGVGTPNGTGTQPIAQVTALSASATELPTTSANVQISLNQFAGSSGVTVFFTVSGTATAGADYNLTGQNVNFDPASGSGSCFIPANYNSAVLTLVPVADGIAEPAESATITLASGMNYTIVPGAAATVTITDTPALPASWNFDAVPYPNPLPATSGFGSISFSGWGGTVTNFSGTSGNALALVGPGGNNTFIDFRFSMQGFISLHIAFATRGTASGYDTGRWSFSVDGANFTTLANINTASRSATFVQRAVDFSAYSELDNAPNVTLRYTLSGATGSAGNNRIDDFSITATSAATGDQLRTVQIAASDASASETGDPGVFAIRINGVANPGGLAVGFTLSGSATAPGLANADYELDGAFTYDPATRKGTIVIPEGAGTALLRILPIADTFVEGTETIVCTIDPRPGDYLVGAVSSALINLFEPPPNDQFASALTVPAGGGGLSGNNLEASAEAGEPLHAGYAGGRSVWWNWTAPSSGSVTISTAGSSFDTLLAVYTGDAVNALTVVASDTNSGGQLTSAVRFATVAGTTYRIAVDGYGGATGNINLTVTPSANAPIRPANDNFASNIVLTGNTPSTSASNDYATKEASEPNHAAIAGGKSVWWRWTALYSGSTVVSTSGSNFDTLLAVYTGPGLGSLALVASNNDYSGTTSRVTFNAVAGTTYFLAVDGNYASSGTVALSVTGFAPPPPNDNFVNGLVLTGTNPSASGTNAGATKETGEPNHANNSGGKSVWWRWTAPASGTFSITTAGSNFDTTLGVYTGSAVNALTLIGGDDDSGPGVTSLVTFNATAGVTYQIAVDGYSGASGSISLALSPPVAPPANDNFASAFTLTGDAPSTSGTNLSATREPGEPNHAGDPGGHSVWWRWTSTRTGYVSVSTAGSNFDTLLAVYTGSAVNALTLVAANDQANDTDQSQLVFAATAGVEYFLAVDGWAGGQGNVALALNGPLPPPQVTLFTLDDSAAERPLDSARFYLSLADAQPQPVTVGFTVGGSATPGVDYTLDAPLSGNTGSVTFAPNETIKMVTLTPLPDGDFTEFDETIVPALVGGSGYVVGNPATGAVITLHDDTPYNAAWAQLFAPAFTGLATHPLADFSGNGVANLLVFAFNGDPRSASLLDLSGQPLLPVAGTALLPDPADGNLLKPYATLTFNRRTDAPQLSYLVETADNLTGPWSTDAVLASVTTTGLPPGIERVTYRAAQPLPAPRKFLRVRLTAP